MRLTTHTDRSERPAVDRRVADTRHLEERPLQLRDNVEIFRTGEAFPVEYDDVPVVLLFVSLHGRTIDDGVATEIRFEVFGDDLA